jgi:DNA modification methylase
MNIIDQSIGENYALYHGDCVDVLRGLRDDSVDFSVFSPPFASLYTYSASPRDFGNSSSYGEFFDQYAFLAIEQFRTLKPGRLMAVHCMQLTTTKGRDGFISVVDFRGDLIRAYQKAGFIYHSEVTIWKNPVNAMHRTKANRLLYMQLKKDSVKCGQGFADYLVIMGKPGENAEPVTKDPVTFSVEYWQRYASPVWATMRETDNEGFAICTDKQTDDSSSGIDPGDTLQFRSARDHEDERHICPLQLPVIRRSIQLWSNHGDIVLSPFAGIGSEGYVALQEGRRFIGAELKASYYKQASRNLAQVANPAQMKLDL